MTESTTQATTTSSSINNNSIPTTNTTTSNGSGNNNNNESNDNMNMNNKDSSTAEPTEWEIAQKQGGGSLSNSGKKEKQPHPAKLSANSKKDSKINLHSDGSPQSPSPYVGVKDEFTDWVPVFNKVGRGMTPILAPKESIGDENNKQQGGGGKGGVITEFSSPPIPTKKINPNSQTKASYSDSDDELSPDDDPGSANKQLPTFVVQSKPREKMSDVVNSPRLPPAISDVPNSPKLIPVPSSPLFGAPSSKASAASHQQNQQQLQQKKKVTPPPSSAPIPPPQQQQPAEEDSSSEEDQQIPVQPMKKKAPITRQPSRGRNVNHPVGISGPKAKGPTGRVSALGAVSKRKQSMDSNYLKDIIGDDTEEEDTLVNSEKDVKPKSEELIRELLKDEFGDIETSVKNFKAAFGEKYKMRALDCILRKALCMDNEEERELISELFSRMRKLNVITTHEGLENIFINILEDLVSIVEQSPNAGVFLGEMIANGISDDAIGGEFLNIELAKEEIVKLGLSEVVMESMLRVLVSRDLRKRVEDNQWKLSAFLKPEDMDLKTREWLKSRGYGKIY